MKNLPRAVVLSLVVAVLATGCSSFDRSWRKAPTPADSLAGRWEGRWQSRSGHNGKLRAIITPRTATQYDARFDAAYGPVLSAKYGVAFDVKHRGPRADFRGTADLGVWGRYETTGYATGARFHATYRSKFDRGTFEMRRPAEEGR